MSFFPESKTTAPVTLVEHFKSISPARPVVSLVKLLAGDESQISKMIIASTLGGLFYLDLRSNVPKVAKILWQFRVLLSLAKEGMKRGNFMIKKSPAVQAGR